MFSFILNRLLTLIPVALGVVIIISLMIHLVPGDPVDLMLGDFATAEAKQLVRTQLGLNLPIYQQIFKYIEGLFHGNLGKSLIYNRPVLSLLLERLPPTLELALASLLVAIVMGLPLGVLGALRKDRFSDHLAMTFALLGVAIPNFWLGPMLILLFSIHMNMLPVSGMGNWTHFILPALTIGTSLAAIISRMARNSILDTLREDYVRTARAKGAHPFFVIFKHVLRNASLPLVTILGLQFGVLLTGAVVTEKIYDWPGLGTLILDALGNRDYPLVQGCVLFFSSGYLIVNLVTDLFYKVVDPRVKF
ncbi:MAG: ABC transporter permease [Deltaproteobacteria bacterium]|nr:ABC transporter permease [Deltaproteobacteria bacterium]